MTDTPFDLYLPERRETPVIFASPHSGRDYFTALLGRSVLDARTIRSSEDAFVDLLFGAAPRHGAPLLAARVPRAWIDLNRAPDELDPMLIDGVGRPALNPRITSGLGVIPRVVANGRAIYRHRLSRSEAEARIAAHWVPYHDALQGLITENLDLFGKAVLIDCHSMPHEAIASQARPGRPAPQIVLGDRHGAAAGPHVMDRIEAAFRGAGFNVARNNPFAGVYVSQAYGRPQRGQHVVQIEIDRALYMDESRICPAPGFEAFRDLLNGVIAEITQIGRDDAVALAAE